MIKILYLSNLLYSKGILDLLEALSKLNPKVFSLKIAGQFVSDDYCSEEEMKIRFTKEMNRLKDLQYDIHYLGPVRQHKNSLFEEADIFCLPTFYKTEACPLVLMEAVKFNSVVITTDWKYLRNFSRDTLIYITPRSTKQLTEKILKLQDYEERKKCLLKQELWKNSFSDSSTIANKIINTIKGT